MVTSKPAIKPLYVYCQALSSKWLTVGAYWRGSKPGEGFFQYAPSYLEADHAISIDPIHLPITGKSTVFKAERYQGLHDVLRDASPDSWGQQLLIKYSGLNSNTLPLDFLKHSSNVDRWGALAIGDKKKPALSQLATPKLPDVDLIVAELNAMESRKLAVDETIRNRLREASAGGARPKATAKKGDGTYWLIKPESRFDTENIPMLEHFCQSWGRACGLQFCETSLVTTRNGSNAVLVKRFDRINQQRILCLSAATLLSQSFPATSISGLSDAFTPSYPRLSSQLRLIGSPSCDRQQLFLRMVFNCLVGNDDDHLRNHAVYFDLENRTWRLAPAYDVVPNTDSETPQHLWLALSGANRSISRSNLLADYIHFSFESENEAAEATDELISKAHDWLFENQSALSNVQWERMKTKFLSAISLIRDL